MTFISIRNWSPGRTGLVIAALAATGALLVQTAGFIRSTEDALLTWIDEKIAADLFVASGSSVSSAGLPMPEKVGEQLRAQPEVKLVLPVRTHQMPLNDHTESSLLVVCIDARLHVIEIGRDEANVPRAGPLQNLVER